MKISKYVKITNGYTTKALRFIKGDKVRFILSYSVATNGQRWLDDNKKGRIFGMFKKIESMFTARALVIGKLKLSLVTTNLPSN
jgi:hypothetical protein